MGKGHPDLQGADLREVSWLFVMELTMQSAANPATIYEMEPRSIR